MESSTLKKISPVREKLEREVGEKKIKTKKSLDTKNGKSGDIQ
jgi:hypothetical protein